MELIKLTDSCLAVAGLPETDNTWINPYLPIFLHVGDLHGDAYTLKLPTGNWRILGKANDLTDEQWKEVVHYNDTYKDYLNYLDLSDWGFDTATESGASLLQLHKLENPLILIKL